jgi:hypothetical protein
MDFKNLSMKHTIQFSALILFLVQCITIASAQDSRLDALSKTVVPLRALEKQPYKINWWGAVPELTEVKHNLRDFIEERLAGLKQNGDEKAVETHINSELKAAGLIANDKENMIGYVGDIDLTRSSGLVILKTSVGILCQYDQSAYAYEWAYDRWNRVWESEQVDYTSGKYSPQYITSIHVWQPFRKGHKVEEHYVLSLGHDWGCASTWHNVYWRVWRIASSGNKQLIEGSHFAFLRADSFIVGSIGDNHEYGSTAADVLIEFTQASIDGGVHNREGVRHYVIDQDRVRRVTPVALSPRDFVDEWLNTPWKESSDWSSAELKERKKSLDNFHAEFSPTMRCRTANLRQVTLQPYDPDNDYEKKPAVYFLVRWQPPFDFRMVDVSIKPWPLCKQLDDEADQWRTLFWLQEWR